MFNAGNSSQNRSKHLPFDFNPGLKQIAEISNGCNMVTRTKFCEASNMIRLTMPELHSSIEITEEVDSMKSCKITEKADSSILWIGKKYGDKILLKDTDRKPKTSKKKTKRTSDGSVYKQKTHEILEDWQGPPPWDPSLGGDGCPKFLCDVMVCLIRYYYLMAHITVGYSHQLTFR